MKKIKLLSFILLALLFTSCKEKEVKATLLVRVVKNGVGVSKATVYLQGGGKHNPQKPLSQYDQQTTTNENGSAYFNNLDETDYYFVATAVLSSTILSTGSGTASCATKQAPNRYEQLVNLN